jgi:ATP dependent DNA ligase C terminal region
VSTKANYRYSRCRAPIGGLWTAQADGGARFLQNSGTARSYPKIFQISAIELAEAVMALFEEHGFRLVAQVGRVVIPSEFRRVLLPHFEELRKQRCPFGNLPDHTEGRWGHSLTAAKMASCRWLDPFIVARIEFLEWTSDNRLHHPRFAGIRSNKDAHGVMREIEGLP